MSLPNCKTCGEEIAWAFDDARARWVPLDPESLRGDEAVREGDRGLFVELEDYHYRHRCLLGSRYPPHKTPHTVDEPAPPPPPRAAQVPFDLLQAYARLFLLPTAPKEVARAAHRALAAIHHPDRGGNPERMVEINLAFERVMAGR